MADIIAGYQSLTVAATAVSLTIPTPAAGSIMRARIRVAGAVVRIRNDGTAPTASSGEPRGVGEVFEIDGLANLRNFQAIRESSTSATLHIHYFREA